MLRIILSFILSISLSFAGLVEPMLNWSEPVPNALVMPVQAPKSIELADSAPVSDIMQAIYGPRMNTVTAATEAKTMGTRMDQIRAADEKPKDAAPQPAVQPSTASAVAAAPVSAPTANAPVSTPQPSAPVQTASLQPAATETPVVAETPKPASPVSQTPKPVALATPTPLDPSPAPAVAPAPAADNGNIFDFSRTASGVVGVRYLNQSGRRVRLMIEKGSTRYTYLVRGDNTLETFPLQSGNGEYTITLLENTEGRRYRVLLSEIIQVALKDSNLVFLASIPMINWNGSMAAIKKAGELTAGLNDDAAKITAVYNFVVRTIRYDLYKLESLPSTYLPSIDDTLRTQSGICYDFASLFAAMLRSVGVPTKLVKGYADGVDGFHAWNEVYVNGSWQIIDTSVDSQLRERGMSFNMFKNRGSYQKQREF